MLTQKSSVIDLWLGSKYVFEGFLISVWFLKSNSWFLKRNPFKWNWLLFKNSFPWSKGLLYKKGEKCFILSFSRCKKILLSKWVLSLFPLYWRFKASCSDVRFSGPSFVSLTSVFEALFIWETRRDKKGGVDDKTENENLFHHFFIELLLEHVTVNETGAFGIPPDKGNRVQYIVYTLPFYNQPVYKQTVLVC